MKSGKLLSPSQSKYDPSGPEEPLSSDQAFDSIHSEASLSEELGATYRLSDMDTTKNAILQHKEISDAEQADTTLIPAKELNEQFSDLGTPFTEPKPMAVANIIAERQRKRQALAETIANGPQGNLYGIARFATAMVPHALDPVNIGTSLAVGALTEGLGIFPKAAEVIGEGAIAAEGIDAAAAAVNVARSGNVVKNALQSQFTKHFAEGVVGNAVGEGMVARSALQEGREYSAEDAFLNTVGGALMIPGAVLGFQKIAQGLRYTGKFALNRTAEYLNRIDPKYSETMLKTSEARLLSDKPLGVEVYGEHAMAELHGKSPEWAGPLDYKYEKLGEQVPPEKKFYAATYDHAESIHTGRTEPFDQFLGNAVYATDNPTVANGAAARGFKDGNGRIVEIGSDGLRLLDLNQPIPEHLKETFAAHDVKMPDGTSLMDALHKIQDEIQSNKRDPWALDKLNEDLKASGYDGYISDGVNVEGMSNEPHNSVSIFNKEKLKETKEIQPEPDKVGNIAPEIIQKAQRESATETSHAISNPDDSIKELKHIAKRDIKSPELSAIEKSEADLTDKAQRLDEQGMLEPEDKKVLEDVADAKKEAGILQKLMDYASDCVGYH